MQCNGSLMDFKLKKFYVAFMFNIKNSKHFQIFFFFFIFAKYKPAHVDLSYILMLAKCMTGYT